MENTPCYKPPSSDAIDSRQNEGASIRLLLAQRRMYTKAKRYFTARFVGMAVIGIAAPIVSILWPDMSVVAGAVAGLWIFLGRTWLSARECFFTKQAAAIQERFDCRVFAMPEVASRDAVPSPEDVALLTTEFTNLHLVASEQSLLDWYPIKSSDPGTISVAISQRANVAYTDKLLRMTANVWMTCAVVWVIAVLLLSILVELSLRAFILGIFLPVLPASLDVVQFMRSVHDSAKERADLALTIQRRLENSSKPIGPDELLMWQKRLFDLRSTTPLVPDCIYWFLRNRNEAAMHAAAEELRGSDGGASSYEEEDN